MWLSCRLRFVSFQWDVGSVRKCQATPTLCPQIPTISTCIAQAPPKTPDVQVDGVHALKLTERVTLLRGICNDRFKFEVEYGLKRGTSDNCYVVRVRRLRALSGVAVGVPCHAGSSTQSMGSQPADGSSRVAGEAGRGAV